MPPVYQKSTITTGKKVSFGVSYIENRVNDKTALFFLPVVTKERDTSFDMQIWRLARLDFQFSYPTFENAEIQLGIGGLLGGMKLLSDTSDYWSFIGFGDISIGAKIKINLNKSLLIKTYFPLGLNISFLWGIPRKPKNELLTIGVHLYGAPSIIPYYSCGLSMTSHLQVSSKFTISPTFGGTYQLTPLLLGKSKQPEYQFFAGLGFN